VLAPQCVVTGIHRAGKEVAAVDLVADALPVLALRILGALVIVYAWLTVCLQGLLAPVGFQIALVNGARILVVALSVLLYAAVLVFVLAGEIVLLAAEIVVAGIHDARIAIIAEGVIAIVGAAYSIHAHVHRAGNLVIAKRILGHVRTAQPSLALVQSALKRIGTNRVIGRILTTYPLNAFVIGAPDLVITEVTIGSMHTTAFHVGVARIHRAVNLVVARILTALAHPVLAGISHRADLRIVALGAILNVGIQACMGFQVADVEGARISVIAFSVLLKATPHFLDRGVDASSRYVGVTGIGRTFLGVIAQTVVRSVHWPIHRVAGVNGTVKVIAQLRRSTGQASRHCIALRRYAGFDSVADIAVSAEGIVRDMEDIVGIFVAGIHRTADGIIQDRRLTGKTAFRRVACLGTVAEQTVSASGVVRLVGALASLRTRINRAGYLIVTHLHAFGLALAILALSFRTTEFGRQVARTAVHLVLELAPHLFFARVGGAAIAVVAVHRCATAFQIRTFVEDDACIVFSAGITIIAANSLILPIEQTWIRALLRLLIAPSLLARMLCHATVR